MLLYRPPPAALLVPLCITALAATTGCNDTKTLTEPPRAAASAPSLSIAPQPARLGEAVQFDDVVGRVLPSFADQTVAAELRARLSDFSDAYRTGNDTAARYALNRAQALLARSGAHTANVGAIRLALGNAAALLDSASTTEAAEVR